MGTGEWTIEWTQAALKQRDVAIQSGYRDKLKSLIGILRINPFEPYPPYEKLKGDLSGLYSRRMNQQHRLVYSVNQKTRTARVVSCWTHYETIS